MKKTFLWAMVALAWSSSGWCAGSESGGGGTAANGLIQFTPPQPMGSVAVRVEVPEGKMVTGVRWYNGSATAAFPRILVASGRELAPPPFNESVTMVQDVVGQQEGWSTAEFATPVASETGTLFVVVEYPANYTPPESGTALGVGYSLETARFPHFVTGDGETWIRVGKSCRVLLEPILADRLPGVVALRGPLTETEPPTASEKLGLFVAPNPFNPQTEIELTLAATSSGTVRVYDLRGHLVIELHRGVLVQGANAFVWKGRDAQGRGVASGAYWVQARTDDQLLTRKILLLK